MSRPASRAPGLVLLAAALLVGACAAPGSTGAPDASSSSAPVSPAPSATVGPTPTTAPAATTPTATPSVSPDVSPEPTSSLPAFTCTLPINVAATASLAQIHDIRVGTHDGYDRLVWEFESGIPAVSVERAQPPFVADPSGLPLTVQGTSFLKIVMQGGTTLTPDYTKSYAGPTDLTPGYPMLVELKIAGDFEGVSSWYVGMTAGACVRVFTLSAPDRLVIDLEH